MREPDGRQHSFSHDTNGSHARPSDPYDRREALSGGGLGRLLGKADDVLPGGGAGALDDLPGGGSMLDDAPGAGGAGGGPPGCFPAGTPIRMADGTEKPIEAVQVGDEVATADEATGEPRTGKVTRTFVRRSAEMLTLRLADGREVRATPEHPFWVEGKGFVAARGRPTGRGSSCPSVFPLPGREEGARPPQN